MTWYLIKQRDKFTFIFYILQERTLECRSYLPWPRSSLTQSAKIHNTSRRDIWSGPLRPQECRSWTGGHRLASNCASFKAVPIMTLTAQLFSRVYSVPDVRVLCVQCEHWR